MPGLIDDSGAEPVEIPYEVDEPQGKPSGVAVLLTHGAGGSLSTPGLKALGAELAAMGHLCVRFDMTYRALGRKSPPKAEKSAPGYAAIFSSAVQTFGPDLLWVAGGRSYGGRVASLAAADGMPAAGLLLYSYPLHRPGDPSQPRADHFERLACPCLFLAGTHDPFCELDLLKASIGRIRAGAEVLVVEGGEHGLKVSKARSPDGQARSEQKVLSELGPQLGEWLSALRL